MGYTSDSNQITREYFDSILVETRYVDSELPDYSMDLWGEKFNTPIMTAALSHLHQICPDAMAEMARGAKGAGAVHFVGMGEDKELEDILETGARAIKIIKPHYDNELIFRKIEHAREHGAFAVGMDIDHCYNSSGGYDTVYGLPMKPKSLSEIRAFVEAAQIPFVVKGVLSVRDAQMCVEAGAKGIVVSHHHGIMPYSVPPLMVLPEIVHAVDGQMKIFVDCGIESGMDVYKALALGADAVCVGRGLMGPLREGKHGVSKRILEMSLELSSVMARTGVHSLEEMDASVLHFRKF